MMNNGLKGTLKGCWIYARPMVIIFAALITGQLLVQIIVSSFIENNSNLSVANISTFFILVISLSIPLYFLRQIMEIGADRRGYYQGVVIFYLLTALIFAFLNIVFYMVETLLLKDYLNFGNMLNYFGWDANGLIGMVFYQLGAYLLVMSFTNLIFSGIREKTGIIMVIILAALLAVFLSVPDPRLFLGSFLSFLLFNPDILISFLASTIISIGLFLGGWYIIKNREVG
ncbi:MAG: hypothetical protein ACLFUI_05760 [Halanaerobiales bacterium]